MRASLKWLTLSAAAFVAGQAAAQELLIHGGPIYTGTAKVEALAVKDGKVAFAGPLAQARAAVPGAQDVDLAGAAAFPGFVDAHAHLSGVGFREMTLSLEGTPSAAALTERLKT
ncbi:MAG TPA: amidohydrolase family protein, partial [Phenylobacterium sp.]